MSTADILSRSVVYPAPEINYPGGIGSPSPAGVKQPDFGMPDIVTGLQYTGKVGELSKKYYSDYAALDQFAKTMWKTHKIDVTAPDPSRPESIDAAETFKQGLANIMYTSDMLKESQAMLKPAVAANIAGQYEFDDGAFDQPYANLTPDQAGYSTQLPEAFDMAKSNINRQVDTRGEFQRLQGEQAQFSQPYDQALAADPNDPRAQYLAQAAEQLSPVYNQPTAVQTPGQKSEYVKPFIERVISHKYGGGGWVDSKYTDGTGAHFLESKDFSDKAIGTKVITDPKTGKEQQVELVVEKSVRNPVTGESFFIFKNKSIPPQRFDNVSSNQLLEMGLLPKQFVDEAYKYIGETGGADQTGNIVDNVYLPPSVFAKADAQRKQYAPVTAQSSAASTAAIDKVKSETGPDTLFGFIPYGKKTSEQQSPVLGKPVKIKRNDDGTFAIDNIKEIFPSIAPAELKNWRNVPEAQMRVLLRTWGLEEGVVTPDQIKAKELLEKYK